MDHRILKLNVHRVLACAAHANGRRGACVLCEETTFGILPVSNVARLGVQVGLV